MASAGEIVTLIMPASLVPQRFTSQQQRGKERDLHLRSKNHTDAAARMIKSLFFLLVASAAIAQARISEQESLNFLQQANTFDPENLNEPEGFFAPEESDLPNGDRQLIYSGPEGREACVVCQRASPSDDDDTVNAIRQLKKQIDKLKDLVNDDEPKSRKPRRDRKVRPDEEAPAPEDIQAAPEDQDEPEPDTPDEAPDAPVQDEPAPVTPDQAPDAPVQDQPAPVTQDQAPDAPVQDQPAPVTQDQAPDAPVEEVAPAPEPLLPEEQPAQILKELDEVVLSDPTDPAIAQVKDILNQTAQSPEAPKTPEEAQKREAELKVAEGNLEKLIEKENDPEKKRVLITIIKRIRIYITKTTVIKKKSTIQKKIRTKTIGKIRDFTKKGPNGRKIGLTRTKTIKTRLGSKDLGKVRTFSKTRIHKAGSGSKDMTKTRTFSKRLNKGGSGSRDMTKTRTFSKRLNKGGSGSKDMTKTRTFSKTDTRAGSGSRDMTKTRTSSQTMTKAGSGGSGDMTKTRTASQTMTRDGSAEKSSEETSVTTTEVEERVEYETREEYVKKK
jgi:hypothetical protein